MFKLLNNLFSFIPMDEFVGFLAESKNALGTVDFSKTNVHVVMGNESCDLDSMISALALAYLHNKQNSKTSIPTLVLPVLNILAIELILRTENCYVLDQLNIDKDLLIFRDTVDLEEIQRHGLMTLSIVDHHILRDKDKFMQDSVIEVFDHRPKDPKAVWDDKTSVVLDQVGSCASLIAFEILKKDPDILNETLTSLLYDVIAFDTIGFNPAADKVKQLDITVAKHLESILTNKKDAKERYRELWEAHNNVSHLTPKQLLSKDLKIINGLPIPGLPMLVNDYLKLPNAVDGIEAFSNEGGFSTIVLMGLSVTGDQVARDIGIFAKDDKTLQNKLVCILKESEDFYLEECGVQVPNVTYFRQNNIKKSRKHLLPVIMSVLQK